MKKGTNRFEAGEERLSESAARHRARPVEEMLAGNRRDAEAFNVGDDATLIVAGL